MADITKATFTAWLSEHERTVARWLGIPEYATNNITVAMDGTNGGMGTKGNATDGVVIHIDPSYLKNSTAINLEGAFVHEIAHAVYTIENPEGKDGTDKAIESIASAIRYRMFGGEGWDVPPDAQTRRLAALDTWQLKVVESTLMAGKPVAPVLQAMDDGTITRADYIEANTNPDAAANQGDYALTGQGHAGTTPTANVSGGGGDGSGGGGIDTGGAPGGGGDGGGDSAKKDKQQRAAALRYVQAYGMPIDEEVQGLIDMAATKDWSTAQFELQLQGSQAFKERFPGIFAKDGTLKMSEEQYISAEKAYQSNASAAGINMSGGRMAWLFKNDVSPDEFADRAVADSRLQKNPELYASFKRELVQAGVAKPGDVNTNKELFRFIMGEGNKKWADLWQDSITRYQANQAGITIARNKDRYTAIGQKAIEHISNMGLSEEEMAAKFVQLSDVLGSVLPLEEAGLYGVNKKTAIAATFGGKNSQRARDKVARAVNTDQAFYDQRAANQVYSDEQGGVVTQGVTDRSRQQTSEY